MNFQLQIRSGDGLIWFPPQSFKHENLPIEADSVSELRDTISELANKTTWPYWEHYRIITGNGNPVERWKIKPGRAVRTRSNY